MDGSGAQRQGPEHRPRRRRSAGGRARAYEPVGRGADFGALPRGERPSRGTCPAQGAPMLVAFSSAAWEPRCSSALPPGVVGSSSSPRRRPVSSASRHRDRAPPARSHRRGRGDRRQGPRGARRRALPCAGACRRPPAGRARAVATLPPLGPLLAERSRCAGDVARHWRRRSATGSFPCRRPTRRPDGIASRSPSSTAPPAERRSEPPERPAGDRPSGRGRATLDSAPRWQLDPAHADIRLRSGRSGASFERADADGVLGGATLRATARPSDPVGGATVDRAPGEADLVGAYAGPLPLLVVLAGTLLLLL